MLELSVKFASQICHENIHKPLDGDYLADFGIDIRSSQNLSRTVQKVINMVVLYTLLHVIYSDVPNSSPGHSYYFLRIFLPGHPY